MLLIDAPCHNLYGMGPPMPTRPVSVSSLQPAKPDALLCHAALQAERSKFKDKRTIAKRKTSNPRLKARQKKPKH